MAEPFDNSVTNKEVNDQTDTVYGQLDRHTDFNSPVMKRVANKANEVSSARGMTNSSIAVGNATGAVIDKAGEFATKDAEIYSNRSTENQRSETHLEGQNLTNQGNLATQAAQSESALAQIAATGLNSEKLAAGDRIAAQERTDSTNATSRANNKLDNSTRLQLEANNRADTVKAANTAAINANWDNYQIALANIDINASATSQRQQQERITASWEVRGQFLNGIINTKQAEAAVQPPPPAAAPAPQPAPVRQQWYDQSDAQRGK